MLARRCLGAAGAARATAAFQAGPRSAPYQRPRRRPGRPRQRAAATRAQAAAAPSHPGGERWASLRAALPPALASGELLRRLATTLALVALLRLGQYLFVPGLALGRLLGGASDLPGRGLAGLLGSSADLPGSLFSLSIAPLMTAYWVLGIVNAVVPAARTHLNALRDQGRPGREALNSYVTALFFVAAMAESMQQARGLAGLSTRGAAAPAFFVPAVLSLMAGAVLTKFAMQLLEERGLGDGAGVVIALGIAIDYTGTALGLACHLAAHPPPPLAALAAAALCLGTVAATLALQGAELRLPLVFYRRQEQEGRLGDGLVLPSRSPSGGASSPGMLPAARQAAVLGEGQPGAGPGGGQRHFPMRLCPNGARQLLFANFWLGMVAGPASWLGLAPLLASPWFFAAVVFVMESIDISDQTPRALSTYLAQSEAGLRGLSPGAATEAYLATTRRRLRLMNAAALSLLGLGAHAVDAACALLLGRPAGCLSLLLLASTVTSAERQVRALAKGPQVERAMAAELAALRAAGVPPPPAAQAP